MIDLGIKTLELEETSESGDKVARGQQLLANRLLLTVEADERADESSLALGEDVPARTEATEGSRKRLGDDLVTRRRRHARGDGGRVDRGELERGESVADGNLLDLGEDGRSNGRFGLLGRRSSRRAGAGGGGGDSVEALLGDVGDGKDAARDPVEEW